MLTRLLHDPALRARLGAAGRETVETKYSATVQAPRVYEILQSAVAQSGARKKTAAKTNDESFSRRNAQGI